MLSAAGAPGSPPLLFFATARLVCVWVGACCEVGTQEFQPAHTQSAMAQSHYSACYWTPLAAAGSVVHSRLNCLSGDDRPLLDFPRRSSRRSPPPPAIVLTHPMFVVYLLTPPVPPTTSLRPLATVTAFSHLAVRSVRQSCQFTCLECRILPPCPPGSCCNYNLCISKGYGYKR